MASGLDVRSKLPGVEPGCEWIVDAYGCDPAALRSLDALQALFERLIADLQLQPVAPPVWHQFPDAGGITGVVVLSESHLAVHTFPERGLRRAEPLLLPAASRLAVDGAIGQTPGRDRRAGDDRAQAGTLARPRPN